MYLSQIAENHVIPFSVYKMVNFGGKNVTGCIQKQLIINRCWIFFISLRFSEFGSFQAEGHIHLNS